MVIGLFATPSAAASCLDNLAEADFGPGAISLVMKTMADVAAIAEVSGPLTGLSIEELAKRLASLGVSPQDVGIYTRGILNGGAFIAISANEPDVAAAAAEMLEDGNAQVIRTIKDK